MAAELFTFAVLNTVVAWLFTYLIHSTVLIGGAWSAVRLGLVGGPEGREALWKTALVAGLLTATLQMVVEVRSQSEADLRAVWAFRTFEQLEFAGGPVDVVDARLTMPSAACVGALRRIVSDGRPFSSPPEACAGRAAFDWRLMLIAFWGLGAVLMVVRLVRARIGLRTVLAGKVEIRSGEAREILDELLGSTGVSGGVRLTASPVLESPAVVGPKEICLPLRAECGLTHQELRVVLAHELGHMARRDLFWTMFSRILAALFFIQPLNRLAIEEMEAEAEFLCDDWAVRETGEPIALARSLTRISEWIGSSPPAPMLAVVRDRGAPLGRRVRRILVPAAERARSGRARALALVVLLLGATAFVPTVPLPGRSTIRLVRLEEAGPMAKGLGMEDRGSPSGQHAVFIRAVSAEVTTP